MMMQVSPFEHVLASSGGSLSLAVQAGVNALQWNRVRLHAFCITFAIMHTSLDAKSEAD